MALVVSVLQTSLENAFKANVPDATQEQSSQITAMANAMAVAIDAYIKSGVVTIPLGVPVQTVPATGAGATTAPAIGAIT